MRETLRTEGCLYDNPPFNVLIDGEELSKVNPNKDRYELQVVCPVAQKIVLMKMDAKKGIPVRVTCMESGCAFNKHRCN